MATSTGDWGQLVSLTDADTDPFILKDDKFTIGRAKDCNLCLGDNRLVSGHHCYIEKDDDGKVWLGDTSTNGTLLNLNTKIGKGNKKELKHGDEFYIVYKKNEEHVNVGYVYQNLEELEKEMMLEETQEYNTDEVDATLVDDDCNLEEDSNAIPDATSEPPKKKQKREDSGSQSVQETKTKGSNDCKAQFDSKVPSANEKVASSVLSKSGDVSSGSKSGDVSSGSKSGDVSSGSKSGDDIEEILICMICQEIMHDCVSLQPCMHTFCSGCYSDWMFRSNVCPTCRAKVDRINKNHIVNNLIEAYLKEHPDKRRPAEDIADLDKKNTITKDMLYPGKQKTGDCTDSSDYESDSDEGYSPDTSQSTVLNNSPVFTGFGNPVFGTLRALTRCRQCTGYVDPSTPNPVLGSILGTANAAINAVKNVVGLGTSGAGPNETDADSQSTEPSDSMEAGLSTRGDFEEAKKKDDEKINPAPPAFTCAMNQNHVLCQCCLQPMPDRRTEYLQNPNNPNLPAQQCTICYRSFCHGYWGCKKADCLGCIGKFKDLVFGRKSLDGMILDNPYESQIFKEYLDSKSVSLNEVRDKCMENLDNKTYTCRDQARFNITSMTPLCYSCGLRNFKDLAYLYRAGINKQDLPEKVTKRADCYWGKNCRTQNNRPHHAMNFSHICEQTRTG